MKATLRALMPLVCTLGAIWLIRRLSTTLQQHDATWTEDSPIDSMALTSSGRHSEFFTGHGRDLNLEHGDVSRSDPKANYLDDTIESSFPASDPSSQSPISHIGYPVG